MPVVIVHLPDSITSHNERPEKCPHCGSPILQGWGQTHKNILDINPTATDIHRYRCSDCRRTFRHYPQGVNRSAQSLRIRKMAALAWVMGVSSRDVVELFQILGIELSRMMVWREGRELARRLQEQDPLGRWNKYTLDRIYLPGISSRFGVVVVFDAGIGKRIVLGTLDEFNPRNVKAWLEQLAQDFDFQVNVVGTDFLSISNPLATENSLPSL